MLGRTSGSVLVGVEAHLIDIEVDLANGLPTISAVGLPDSSVREGIDRIRSALRHAGFALPTRRIVVNLAPADVRKQGAALDLPIALALLGADEKLPPARLRDAIAAGELGLDGSVRPVRGCISIALAARAQKRPTLVVPQANAPEARLVDGVEVIGVSTLSDAVDWARGHPDRRADAPRPNIDALLAGGPAPVSDLSDVRGQGSARRALEIAAAGGHHLLFRGPPGGGKTMLARRLPGVLPRMTPDEALEVTRVWSAAGLARGLVVQRPFRAPHHGVSLAGMTGGGLRLHPGEISLATRGVLYLDEMNEFRRDALECLRQPLESGRISLVRVHARTEFPAAFQLVASTNPCPCGYYGDPRGRCRCSPARVERYQSRLSGPLLDRFDLVVEVPPVDVRAMEKAAPGESSDAVRDRVARARECQDVRGGGCNASLAGRDLRRHAAFDRASMGLLRRAAERFGLSARGFDRVRRVARTIADLGPSRDVGAEHVAEALQYQALPGGDTAC